MADEEVAKFTAMYVEAYNSWGNSETLLDAFARVAFAPQKPEIEAAEDETEVAIPVVEDEIQKVAEATEESTESKEKKSQSKTIQAKKAHINDASIVLGDDGPSRHHDSVGTKTKRRSSKNVVNPPGGRSSISFGEGESVSAQSTPQSTPKRIHPGGNASFKFAYNDKAKPQTSGRSPAGGNASFKFAYSEEEIEETKPNGEGRTPAGGRTKIQIGHEEPSKREAPLSGRSPAGGKSSFKFAYNIDNTGEKSSVKLHHAPGGKTSVVLGTDGTETKSAVGSEVSSDVMGGFVKAVYGHGSKLRSLFQEFIGGNTTSKFITKPGFINGLNVIGFKMGDGDVDKIFERYSKNGGISYSSFVRMLSFR
mmetsp:Transcript_44259/g.71147  ORF Transcript_44259/g.71147 Transcript_44259/m.71147 type:complete len:365 (+) Transcript_44259:79-1173(+)|eukprot:jgi/Bigna1/88763/estExt_fgenesh1_pg.C_370149